jgi:hypothetical protein
MKITTTTKTKSNLGLLYTNTGSTDNNLKGKKTQNYEPNEFDRMVNIEYMITRAETPSD